MMYEQDAVRTLYKKLLAFYPRSFQEELGESMEQTFNDLCNEKRQNQKRLFAPVLWVFIETAIGIFRERLFLISEGAIMQTMLANLKLPAVISFLIVLPFMILEWVTRSDAPRSNASGILFVIMWILPMLFILTMVPVVRNLRAGNSIVANPISLLLRVVFSAYIAWMWFGLVIDQMPCFLGGSGC
jgi:hypothetical protein